MIRGKSIGRHKISKVFKLMRARWRSRPIKKKHIRYWPTRERVHIIILKPRFRVLTFLRRSVIGSWELYSRKISLLVLWFCSFWSFFSSDCDPSIILSVYDHSLLALHWPVGRFKLHLSLWQIFMQIGCEFIMITLSKWPTFVAKTWAFALTFWKFQKGFQLWKAEQSIILWG